MHVAVLGAGYAGVTVARRLERSLPESADIVVVDDSSEHLVRHEVHRLIRRPGFVEDIAVPLEGLFDRARTVTDRVTRVDPDANRVELASNDPIEYDYAAVCLGAETAFYDLPGVEEHALPLRDVEHAETLRAEALDLIDAGGGRVVVGGAGLSGVQVAGELAALSREEEASDRVEVVLTEMRDSVAPGFSAGFQEAVHDALETEGVDVRTGVTIEGADGTVVAIENGEISYDLFVWTGGISGPAPLENERPRVRSNLRHGDSTFVVGDAAMIVDREGEAVPASAQAALAEAEVAATNIADLVEYDRDGGTFEPRLEGVSFSPTGWVVSVGDGTVAIVGGAILRGRAALAAKATSGVGHLSSIGATSRAIELAREEFAKS
ncbi:MAG: NAD(P)/FAD-dependent oxidoreductase [Halobacteriales archaeon]